MADLRIKSLLLDVDGTLIDSNDAHAHAWLEALAEAGFNMSFQAVRERIGMGGDHLLPSLLGISGEEGLGERLAKRRGEIFRAKYLDGLKPFRDVRLLIERFLSLDLRLVVATSSPKEDLEGLLEKAGVRDLLLSKTSADDAESSKPDPDIILAALKKAKCEPRQALMIGDTPYDVSAALKAGVGTLAFECGGWHAEKLSGAVAVYQGPWHLLRELESSPIFRS